MLLELMNFALMHVDLMKIHLMQVHLMKVDSMQVGSMQAELIRLIQCRLIQCRLNWCRLIQCRSTTMFVCFPNLTPDSFVSVCSSVSFYLLILRHITTTCIITPTMMMKSTPITTSTMMMKSTPITTMPKTLVGTTSIKCSFCSWYQMIRHLCCSQKCCCCIWACIPNNISWLYGQPPSW